MKKKWLRIILTVAVFAMVLGALAACGGASPTAAPAATQPPPTKAAAPTQAPTKAPAATQAPTQAPAATQSSTANKLPDLHGKHITVAVENAYPPFNFIDKKTGKPEGWDYDTVREICKRINCVPEFKQASWDGIFPAMQAGEYDMLADGVTITPERAKIVDFSEPYVTIGQVLLVRADEKGTLEDFKKDSSKIIGTQIGTTNEIVAKKTFPPDRVKSFEDFGGAIMALLSGDIDGVVIDNVTATGFMKENPGKLKIAAQITSDEKLGFVFPPGSPLKDAVNAALESMKADGTLQALNKKWGLVAGGENEQGQKLPDLHGKHITVAVENAYPPFNFIDKKTGKPEGWDYDTVREICRRINCVPEFKQASWDGIFPAMQAGEYDMLADGVTITPERAKIVDFSEPYVTIGQVLLVRADEKGTLEDFKKDSSKIIGTQIGTTNEIVAKKTFPPDRVKSFEDFGGAIMALLSGDIDGVVIDNVTATGFMKENPGKLKIAAQITSDEKLGFVFPPGSPLKDAVNAALESMKADGTLQALNKKWGLTQ